MELGNARRYTCYKVIYYLGLYTLKKTVCAIRLSPKLIASSTDRKAAQRLNESILAANLTSITLVRTKQNHITTLIATLNADDPKSKTISPFYLV